MNDIRRILLSLSRNASPDRQKHSMSPIAPSEHRIAQRMNRGSLQYVCFSNRPVRVKRFQAIQPLRCRCRSRARASLRRQPTGGLINSPPCCEGNLHSSAPSRRRSRRPHFLTARRVRGVSNQHVSPNVDALSNRSRIPTRRRSRQRRILILSCAEWSRQREMLGFPSH